MGAMASQITSLTIDYSTVYSGEDQRKHQSSTSLALVRNYQHKMASNAENVSIGWRHHENFAMHCINPSDAETKIPGKQGQYYSCWCPGDARSQGISSYDIDYAMWIVMSSLEVNFNKLQHFSFQKLFFSQKNSAHQELKCATKHT